MRTLLAVAVTALLCSAVSATAASVITGRQVKNGSLTGTDIKNRSIRLTDLAKSARGARGPVGAAGPVGAQGPKGDTAQVPPFRIVADRTSCGFNGQPRTCSLYSLCPNGMTAIGGGYRFTDGLDAPIEDADTTVVLSEAADTPAGHAWHVIVRNDGTPQMVATITAVCTSTPLS